MKLFQILKKRTPENTTNSAAEAQTITSQFEIMQCKLQQFFLH